MKKYLYLLVPLLLFCQRAYCGKDYSTSKTMYVGATLTLNPKSDCGANYCFGTGITLDTGAFHVEKVSHTNSLGMQKTNGSTTGTYHTFKLTALKAGKYTVKCNVSYYESISGYKNRSNIATYTITVKEVPKVVSISMPSSLSLIIGNTYTFTPTIYEEGASTTLTWSSSNSSVASISNGGVLTAKAIGTTTVTCTASNGVKVQCVVTVNPILANGISLNAKELELVENEKTVLTATISPNNVTSKTIKWSSSNTSVATVDGNGVVTAVKGGSCVVTATTADGTNYSASCQVNVLADVLYAENAVGVPSGILQLPIQLKNASSITGLQFELQLPKGISVAIDNNKLICTLSDRAVNQSITGSMLSNGNYQFVVFSNSSSAFSGSDGAIAYVTLNIDDNIA